MSRRSVEKGNRWAIDGSVQRGYDIKGLVYREVLKVVCGMDGTGGVDELCAFG